MPTFSFDRPIKLSPEETERFFEIAMKPAKPDGIKPISLEQPEKKRKW